MSTVIDPYEQQKDRFQEWFGLRHATETACPRVVAGHPCRYGLEDDICICGPSQLLDHARMWRDVDGRLVYTAEPYQAHCEDIVTFMANLRAEGLCAHFYGRSPWNPGGTFLIIVRASQEREEM